MAGYPAFLVSTPGSVTRRVCSPHDGFPLFLVRRDRREWNCPRPEDPLAHEFLCCLDISGDVVCKDMFEEGDLVVFTD